MLMAYDQVDNMDRLAPSPARIGIVKTLDKRMRNCRRLVPFVTLGSWALTGRQEPRPEPEFRTCHDGGA